MKIRRDALFRLRVRAHALALEERRQRVMFALDVVAELYRTLARELDELESETLALWDAIDPPEQPETIRESIPDREKPEATPP